MLLLVAIMAGGGPSFTNSMLVELLAIASLGAWLFAVEPERLLQDRWTGGLIVCLVAIAIIELAPLPVSWWTMLAGRDLALASLSAAQIAPSAHPLSLNPSATVQTLLATLPAVSVFVAARHADSRQITQWLLVVIGAATSSAMLGVIQVSTANLYFYGVTHHGYPVGWFANRNHEGDFLLVALVLGVGIYRKAYSGKLTATKISCYGAFFAICTLATASRSAITLLPIALAASIYIAFACYRLLTKRTLAAVMVGAGLLIGLLAILNSVLFRAFERFGELSDDLRPEIWRNSWTAIGRFWPAGSGLGTFVNAYAAIEPLKSVSTYYINAAHNDYLQILVELGIIAIPIALAYAIAFGYFAFQSWRKANPLGIACSAGILIVLLHSLTDYPLRTEALLSVFALMNAVLVSLPLNAAKRMGHGENRSVSG